MVVSSDREGSGVSGADLLGLSTGLIVQELGWDEDCDEEFRSDVMDIIDDDLLDEDTVEAVDVVLLWQRDDTDVTDSLVDALRDLTDSGYIWLLTPTIGQPHYVDQVEIAEGVHTAGLMLTSTVNASPFWQAHKVVRTKGARR